MLMMKCPYCQNYIKSVLLAELKEIECDQCKARVKVENVLVSANGFTFERNDLLKRFFRYRKLLDEAIEERNALNDNSTTSEASRRSIEKFLEVLQGMMAGARDHFRYEFSKPLTMRMRYGGQECAGGLTNLSMNGACVETSVSNPLPRVKTEMLIFFRLPGHQQDMELICEICWARQGKADEKRGHSAGLRFKPMGDADHDIVWNFILENTQ